MRCTISDIFPAGSFMKAVQSPLFEPVHWVGEGFKILDETEVPDRISYIEVRSVERALEAVHAGPLPGRHAR